MKRWMAIGLAACLLLGLAGCGVQSDPDTSEPHERLLSNSDPDYILREDDETYLILPVSKEKVGATECENLLSTIAPDMLKAAEEKVNQQVAQYEDDSKFYLYAEDGHLYLCKEVIVELEYSVPESGECVLGCGIDHDHLFFKERISK